MSGLNYFLISFFSSAACAIVISIFVDFLGIVPYAVLTKIITINNTVAGWIGVILLTTVFGFIKDGLHLFWPEVLDEEEIGRPVAGPLGAWVVCSATLFGLFGGYLTDFGPGAIGGLSSLAIILGCLLL